MMSKMLVLAATVSVAMGEHFANKVTSGGVQCSDQHLCVGGGYRKEGDFVFCAWGDGPTRRCYAAECSTGAPTDGTEACKVISSSNHESIGTTTVNGDVAASEIYENMRGWRDIPKSRIFNFPDSLLGRRALIPSVYVGAGYVTELDCPIERDFRTGKCDMFVFLYRCPPCQFKDGGNLAADLLAQEWMPYTCDVRFKLDPSGHEHSTIVYHKQVERGDFVDIIPSGELELAWFSRSPATAHCGDFKDEHTCRTEQPRECEWKNDECNRVLCPRKVVFPKGPFKPKCTTCIDDERHFMPTITP